MCRAGVGMIRAWFFPAMTPAIGHSFWLVPVLATAGTLFVIPTAAEVPIIQILQQFGLGGAGAAALLNNARHVLQCRLTVPSTDRSRGMAADVIQEGVVSLETSADVFKRVPPSVVG